MATCELSPMPQRPDLLSCRRLQILRTTAFSSLLVQ